MSLLILLSLCIIFFHRSFISWYANGIFLGYVNCVRREKIMLNHELKREYFRSRSLLSHMFTHMYILAYLFLIHQMDQWMMRIFRQTIKRSIVNTLLEWEKSFLFFLLHFIENIERKIYQFYLVSFILYIDMNCNCY